MRSAWFDDPPLDFSREDTREAETILDRAYSTQTRALTLGESAGLDLTALDHDAEENVGIPQGSIDTTGTRRAE